MNNEWTDVARCPACEYQETADDDWSLYHPNRCPVCGTRFFLSARHTPSYQSRIIPPPRVVPVMLEPGQIWRGMGPMHALRLDQYEPAHGQVGEGWYVTFGTMDSEHGRLIKKAMCKMWLDFLVSWRNLPFSARPAKVGICGSS